MNTNTSNNTNETHDKSGRAADLLTSQIESSILSGQLHDGETLPSERKLMSQYGVSRTVVREAITKLSGKGLILSKPRFRPIVRKPGFDSALDGISGIVQHLLQQPNGIKNLFDARIMMEAMLVREAALNANKEDIKRLRNALEANKAAIDSSQQFYATDVAFHAVLYAIPGNPVLQAVHKAYTHWLSKQWGQMPRNAERNQINYEAHSKIFNGILNRDPDEAENALREHLKKAWSDVKLTFPDIEQSVSA